MFTEKFDSYACEGDSITCEVDGFELTATIHRDSDCGIDDDDCHNPDQSVTGCNDEQFAALLKSREAWQNDEWFYCGIVISAKRNGVTVSDHAGSLWGIECNYPGSDNSYLSEVANELLQESAEHAKLCAFAIVEKLKA